MRLVGVLFLVQLLAATAARAGDLAFSDPANVGPAPAWAARALRRRSGGGAALKQSGRRPVSESGRRCRPRHGCAAGRRAFVKSKVKFDRRSNFDRVSISTTDQFSGGQVVYFFGLANSRFSGRQVVALLARNGRWDPSL